MIMKKYLGHLIVLSLFLSQISCSFYLTKFRTTDFEASYLDLSSGKWLLNFIETDFTGKGRDNLKRLINDQLSRHGCDSLYYVGDIYLQYVLPSALVFDVSDETLSSLKSTTDYDYLICVSTGIKENDYEVHLWRDTYETRLVQNRETGAELRIYNINSGKCIYNHSITASNSVDQSGENFIYSKNTYGMVFKSLKKILKEIKAYVSTDPN